MIELADWEVEEFIEQVAIRPRLWLGRDKLWVRHHHATQQFAVKFVNGLPESLSAVHIKVLDAKWSSEVADRYVDWLVHKFTSYTWRKSVEALLVKELRDPSKALSLSLQICNPSQGAEAQGPQDVVATYVPDAPCTAEPFTEEAPRPKVPVLPSKPSHSTYIARLLGKKR